MILRASVLGKVGYADTKGSHAVFCFQKNAPTYVGVFSFLNLTEKVFREGDCKCLLRSVNEINRELPLRKS